MQVFLSYMLFVLLVFFNHILIKLSQVVELSLAGVLVTLGRNPFNQNFRAEV